MANEYKMARGERIQMTDAEQQRVNTMREEENVKKDARAWLDGRLAGYGNISDQLDEIFHDIDAWKTRIAKVKSDNPK